MKGFYSVRPRVRSGIMRPRPASADVYAAGSADYAERHKAHEVQLPNGLVRVDMGEPVKPLPCQPQPVLMGNPKALPRPAPALTPAEDAPAAAPATSERKRHRAITRNP